MTPMTGVTVLSVLLILAAAVCVWLHQQLRTAQTTIQRLSNESRIIIRTNTDPVPPSPKTGGPEPRVLTYEEWLTANNLTATPEECGECFGDGVVECPECGHSHECEECEGRGEWDVTRDEYEQQVKRDRAKLLRHQSRTP